MKIFVYLSIIIGSLSLVIVGCSNSQYKSTLNSAVTLENSFNSVAIGDSIKLENIVTLANKDQINENINTMIDNEEDVDVGEYNGFVLLKDLDKDFMFDIRYATNNNFTHTIIYPNDICVLRKETAYKLVQANILLKEKGFCIKIYDAYRSLSVQKKFWSIMPDDNYVANPYAGGSIHNRGCAVDLTIVSVGTGQEVEMPSQFDDFTEKAGRASNMTAVAKQNLDILTNVMITVGMEPIDSEWWHFEDSNKNNYGIADIDLSSFK